MNLPIFVDKSLIINEVLPDKLIKNFKLATLFNICLMTITKEYLRISLTKATRIFVAYKNSVLVAFASVIDGYDCTKRGCKLKLNNTVYIDLICGGPYMKSLLAHIIYQSKNNGIKYITTFALPQVILWYKKIFGFNISFTCTEDPRHVEVLRKIISRKKKYSYHETLSDTVFKKFLTTLYEHNISKLKLDGVKCQNGVSEDNNCNKGGYFMKLCLGTMNAKIKEKKRCTEKTYKRYLQLRTCPKKKIIQEKRIKE